jgi:subtilisin family serine protease
MEKTIIPKYFVQLFIVFILFVSTSVQSAVTSYYFYVQFANKNNSPYSLSNLSEFLSARAIARRITFSVSCDSTDLPINPSYLQQVENLGVLVHCKSKWMNGATVLLTDSSKMSLVRALPFVKRVQYTGKIDIASPVSARRTKNETTTTEYGNATTQINQLNGKYLHNLGFRGKNIVIGVIDAGFNNVNVNHAFDSLRLQGRLLGTKDIINPNSNIYAEDAHGAMVLSTMTGNSPGQFLGTAPDASFWLIRTEYALTEYVVETDFWCAGIEFADSVGVDVVNSSLGYSTFDDTKMNFTYADMNGKVSRASLAANLASKKGIIVVCSAGNEGDKAWHYLSSPSDAEGIVTVGAIQTDSISSVFSSFGPSSDSRVKPEVCALGTASSVVNTIGTPIYANGTSFSSPIMAGMMACFLQKALVENPYCNLQTLLQSVFKSGSLYNNPTAQKGYGIPNFQKAVSNLVTLTKLQVDEINHVTVVNDNVNKTLQICFIDFKNFAGSTIQIYSITGNLLINKALTQPETVLHTDKLASGIYAVCISGNDKTSTFKVIIR